MKKISRKVLLIAVSIALLCTSIGYLVFADQANTAVQKETKKATVVKELKDKRSKYEKRYLLSDGSYEAVAYTEPVHYRNSQSESWKEVNTNLVEDKNDSSILSTKSSSMNIKIARKSGSKKLVTLESNGNTLSWGLTGNNHRNKEIVNDEINTDSPYTANNENTVEFKDVFQNIDLSYNLTSEKVKEAIVLRDKTDIKQFDFTLYHTGLKPVEKDGTVLFKDQKGKVVYSIEKMFMADAKNNESSDIKAVFKAGKNVSHISYTPNAEWLHDDKRVYPVVIDPIVVTNQYKTNLDMGLASGSIPNDNHTQSSNLYVEGTYSIPFIKMKSLPDIPLKGQQITGAKLVVYNTNDVTIGPDKKFAVQAHNVTQSWDGYTVTYKNKPAYDSTDLSTTTITGVGEFSLDITKLANDWYAGKANNGVALTGIGNSAFAAALSKSPYFVISYHADTPVEFGKEYESTIKAGEEQYFSFVPKNNIAYEIYTTGSASTEGTVYNSDMVHLDKKNNGGDGNNFRIYGTYWGETFVKVTLKEGQSGTFKIMVKERFAKPELSAEENQAGTMILSWSKIENAGGYELLVTGDGVPKTMQVEAERTTCEYPLNGKLLSFAVRAAADQWNPGEYSNRVFSENAALKWKYTGDIMYAKNDFSSVAVGSKIYTLGGWKDGENNVKYKELAVYDTQNGHRWVESEYPGTVSYIQRASMVEVNGKIYVLGGCETTESTPLKDVYEYDLQSKKWSKKANMIAVMRDMAVAARGDKIYVFGGIGRSGKVDVYDTKTDTWTEKENAAAGSFVCSAQKVNNSIYVLGCVDSKLVYFEYLPNGGFKKLGGDYPPYKEVSKSTVINGKIYMRYGQMTDEMIAYDILRDQWIEGPNLNWPKQGEELQAIGTTLYSLGGYMNGFNALNQVEAYTVEGLSRSEQEPVYMAKDQAYDLEVKAEGMKNGTRYVTVEFDPEEMNFIKDSHLLTDKTEKNGLQMIYSSANAGVVCFKISREIETGKVLSGILNVIPFQSLEYGNKEIVIYAQE